MRVLCNLTVALAWVLSGRVTAQTFRVLHSFSQTPPSNFNTDGAHPLSRLVLSGYTLYGTTESGGNSGTGWGVVFAVNTDGTGFTNLHSFSGGAEGDRLCAGLLLSSNMLYGTALYGGNGFSEGTVFKIGTGGTGLATLHAFDRRVDPNDGFGPATGLVLSEGRLYGATQYGGTSQYGTVFAICTDGTSYTRLHSFTNGDGARPYGTLVVSGNTVYGTTLTGGLGGNGTVFKLITNGTDFAVLHHFTNTDGALPRAGLVLSGSTLFGTTQYGGEGDCGTVYRVDIEGTGFTTLHSFTPTSNSTNSDGAHPEGALALSGSTLYGTASNGGRWGEGTLFRLNTDGTGFINMYDFSAANFIYPGYFTNSDGLNPFAGLVVSGNTLYGTTYNGGTAGNGTVFSLSFSSPQLSLDCLGENVVLRWPTNTAVFTLQSATNLILPAVWTPVSPGPVVIDGQNAVTNPISGTQRYFRLAL